jgi:hypothetical protein
VLPINFIVAKQRYDRSAQKRRRDITVVVHTGVKPPAGIANCRCIERKSETSFRPKCHAMKAQNRSLSYHCVRLAFLDDIDDEQLERLAADVGTRVPLPYRFEDKISWFVGIASAGFHVGHLQLPR